MQNEFPFQTAGPVLTAGLQTFPLRAFNRFLSVLGQCILKTEGNVNVCRRE